MPDKRFLYLALDIGSVIVPLLFSFYPKAPFYKKWKYLLPSTLIPAAIFLAWDEFFTRQGVWGFNSEYLVGISLGSLPLEEVLFFLCIPYACVFTYEALNYLMEKDPLRERARVITGVLALLLMIVGLLNLSKWYTGVTFISLGLLLVLLAIQNPSFLGRFYRAYIVILIPFFLVNGVLTGSWIERPVVWYNNSENLGIRMGTIPFEDTFYGMLLILLNVSLFEYLQRRQRSGS